MGNVGSGLSMADELVLVLTKLFRAVTNENLGYRFNVDKTKVTKIFHRWIDVIFQNLKPLVCWSDKEMIVSNLPYKSHNTIKFLVTISPTGAVTFI